MRGLAQEPGASAPPDQGPGGQRQGSIASDAVLGTAIQKAGLASSNTKRKLRLILTEEMGMFISTNIS